MAKPLSQEEIDILLDVRGQIEQSEEEYDFDALESMMAVGADQRVQPYNFKRPRLFSQDQTRVIHHVHESFARDLSVYLSAQLRTIVDLSLTAVDQVLYSEYVMSSAPPSALWVVEVKELDHKVVFELDPRLVIYTTEKLFGGPGIFLDQPREVSQIEQRIMNKVMTRAFRELEKAWQQAYEIHLDEVAFESNAEFVQVIPAVEPALVTTFEATIYDQRSFINICYPYILLEKMLGRAGMKQWIMSATTPAPPKVRRNYEQRLRESNVEVIAQLGRTTLPLTELMQLQPGDVIPLEGRHRDPIRIFVDEKEKFSATPGRSGNNRALRIVGMTSQDNDQSYDA